MPLDPEDVLLLKRLQAEQRASKKAEKERADSGAATGNSGNQRAVPTRTQGTNARPISLPRAPALAPSVWTILLVAGAIVLGAIIDGTLSEGVFLALLVFVVLGSLAPVVFVPVGLVVIAVTWYKGAGPKLFQWLGGLTNAQEVPLPTVEPVIPDKTFTTPGPNGTIQQSVIPSKTFGGS